MLSGICTEIELKYRENGYFGVEDIRAKFEFEPILTKLKNVFLDFEDQFRKHLHVRTWTRAILLTTRTIPKLQQGRVAKYLLFKWSQKMFLSYQL